MIFDIASANRFMSELYADMYVELVGEYETFGEILDGLLVKYRETINNISYADPNEDYDKFCDYNKENELRRANTAFIMNLTKRDMISRKDVIECYPRITRTHFTSLSMKIIEKMRLMKLQKICFCLLLMGKDFLSNESSWLTTN